jgi:hypothetical protein
VAAETGHDVSVDEVAAVFRDSLQEQFQITLDPLPVAV